jgi:hypothetical protein
MRGREYPIYGESLKGPGGRLVFLPGPTDPPCLHHRTTDADSVYRIPVLIAAPAGAPGDFLRT